MEIVKVLMSMWMVGFFMQLGGPVLAMPVAILCILYHGADARNQRIYRRGKEHFGFDPASPPKNAQASVDSTMRGLALKIQQDPGNQDLRQMWNDLSKFATVCGYSIHKNYELYLTL